MSKKTKKKGQLRKTKVKKIRFKRVFLLLLFLVFLFYLLDHLYNIPINNIIVKGNQYLKDQEVIDTLNLSLKSSYFKTTTNQMNKKVKNIPIIKKVSVKHNFFREIIITVEENVPIYYDQEKQKTILSDKQQVDGDYPVPLLRNYIPDTISDEVIEALSNVKKNIKEKISEIEYAPNDVDEERFLLIMNDGNKVYLTLEKFLKINYYNEIMERVLVKYQNKLGTLYLDEGEYFVLGK